MLKIHCPECKKNFFWTDDMPAQGKCQNADCEWHYDVHSALKQNIDRQKTTTGKNILLCPSCGEEISSRFTICPHCSNVVLGTKIFKKRYFFMAVCIGLIGLSLILKYMVK
jgi:hypothetical protein